MYSIVLYNRVLGNNYFIIVITTLLSLNEKKINSYSELQYIQILEHKIFNNKT